jgi:hypothetical protein
MTLKASWKGPDEYGYWYTNHNGCLLNVRQEHGAFGWASYVDGEPLPLEYGSKTDAQWAAEQRAELIGDGETFHAPR